jgi:tyrosyl-tRNA synthetase
MLLAQLHLLSGRKEDFMNTEERLDLASRGTIEIIQKSELSELLNAKKKPRAYWGFELSGKRTITRPD